VPAGENGFSKDIEFRFIVEIVHYAIKIVSELAPESGHAPIVIIQP